MYVGNGVTKKFPIPNGKDGSVVILKLPNGHGYKMTLNEAYYIQDGNIIFNSAIPPGIEISFNLSDATEVASPTSKSYVVIYADGNIQEVEEDPVLILEEAKSLLSAALKAAGSIEITCQQTKQYILNITSSNEAKIDSSIADFKLKLDNAVTAATLEAKRLISNEWSSNLELLSNQSSIVREDLTALQNIKHELENFSDNIFERLRTFLYDKLESFNADCEAVKKLRPELEILTVQLKSELSQNAADLYKEIRVKVNEELELLQTLRKKIEDKFDTFNAKINSRWDLINQLGVRNEG